MPIKKINEFHVLDTIEKANETPRILIENQDLRKRMVVSGKVLEAQYRMGENYLVLVTEGNPFEEALYVYCFNSSLQLLDSLELSAMYAEGMLRNICFSESGDIHFSFFDDSERWVLKVRSKPGYVLFHNAYPVKRKMPVYHKSWLSLQRL